MNSVLETPRTTARKLAALRNLAERPGTEAEGQAAQRMLDKLAPAPPRNQHAQHTALVKSLLVAICERYMPRAMVWNLNVLVGDRTRNFTRSAPNGAADIVGAIDPGTGIGRACALECKTGSGELSERQRAFRDAWERAGGLYIIAREVKQAMKDLEAELGRGF